MALSLESISSLSSLNPYHFLVFSLYNRAVIPILSKGAVSMKTIVCGLLACFLLSPLSAADPKTPTHEQSSTISVASSDGKMRLQTLCLDAKGNVLALVAQPRGFTAPAKDVVSEIHVITPEGKTLATWKVKFHAHSVNVGPDGKVFVAGDGKVARFDSEGKQLAEIELPHIADLLKGDGEMKQRAEQQVKQQKETFQKIVEQTKERKAKLEAKKAEDRTDLEKKQIEQFERILQSYKQTEKYYESMTVESVLGQLTGRLRIINGIALSEKDLFIVCGETKGYGYAIWRMTHDFKDAKQVLSGVGGCCGQMDIQVHGSDILLAENTKHRFARYDREGKAMGGWGERGKESDGKCFGGCCNPMNLRVGADEIYTAESEGIVKKFNGKGEFVSLVGVAKLQGGCKNVALAVSKKGDKVFFCDQPGSRVIVLSQKGE